jgi:ubiquinone/menaquinone biosynthesis C-methylase UbiE
VSPEFRKDLNHLTWEEVYARQAQRASLVGAWLDALELYHGQPGADIGSGPGFVSLQAARRVGPAGLVYAIDRSAEALAYLERLQHEQGVAQIQRFVADAATLDDETIRADCALVTMVLYRADVPRAMLRSVARFVTPNGRVVVAEFHPDGPCRVGPPREHRLAPEVVTDWCRAEGFQCLDERRQTPEHYLLVLAQA